MMPASAAEAHQRVVTIARRRGVPHHQAILIAHDLSAAGLLRPDGDQAQERLGVALALCESIATGSDVSTWEACQRIHDALTGAGPGASS